VNGHVFGNACGDEVAWLAAAARQVDGEHSHVRCLPVNLFDREIPAVGGMLSAVNENQCG
jgi:hypothetical protein